MLARIVIENFLSFREETEFNMFAGNFKTHKTHVYDMPVKLLRSAAIYGANGANGVIIVKTKSGSKTDNVIINANIRYGISNIDQSTRYKVMNASQYLSYAKEAWVNGGQDI